MIHRGYQIFSTQMQFTENLRGRRIKDSTPFTSEDFNDIIKNVSLGKSPGRDNLPIDAFKNSAELTCIFVACANNTFLQRQE